MQQKADMLVSESHIETLLKCIPAFLDVFKMWSCPLRKQILLACGKLK